MTLSKRWAMAAGLVSFFTFGELDARAAGPTKDQCAQANEDAQTLRKDGKLRAARAQLQLCVDPACPRVVREDCAVRLNDLEVAMPSVVFVAKGPGGNDLDNVKVTIDGAPLASRLDGTAFEVDPGKHTFELVAPGYQRVTRTLVLAEGAKRRQEVVSFAAEATPAKVETPVSAPAPAAATPPPGADTGPKSGGTSTTRILAYALGGVGIVGIGVGSVFGLKAKSTYDDASSKSHCPTGPSSCDAQGVSGGRDAHSQATISTISFIAGGALLAGGVALYLFGDGSSSVHATATASSSGAGVQLGGRF